MGGHPSSQADPAAGRDLNQVGGLVRPVLFGKKYDDSLRLRRCRRWGIGSFNREEPILMGKVQDKTNRSFGWRWDLFRTPEGAWITGYHDIERGYRPDPCLGKDGLTFRAVHPEAAAVWCQKNGHELSESLCADLSRESSPAVPATRIPSTVQLRGIVDAVDALREARRYSGNIAWREEEDVYPAFVQLADAIEAVRPEADSCRGWPANVSDALPQLLSTFDAVVADWGWDRLAEPRRTEYRNERSSWFRENVERPYFEAARSAWEKTVGWVQRYAPTAHWVYHLADGSESFRVLSTESISQTRKTGASTKAIGPSTRPPRGGLSATRPAPWLSIACLKWPTPRGSI